jgi:hypothetical protein
MGAGYFHLVPVLADIDHRTRIQRLVDGEAGHCSHSASCEKYVPPFVGNSSVHHCGTHARTTRRLAPATVFLVEMFGIVIFATMFSPLLQDAVSFHVRIAVVAIMRGSVCAATKSMGEGAHVV